MNVLVFAAHPNDDIIGCGGTIAKHVEAGHNVTVVYMTSGSDDLWGGPGSAYALSKERKAVCSCQSLGIPASNLVFLQRKYGKLKENIDDNTHEIARIIREKKPELIYAPYYSEGEVEKQYHPDHIGTYKLVEGGVKKAADPRYNPKSKAWVPKAILCYETHIALEKDEVKYVVNISRFLDKKIEAANARDNYTNYSSRMDDFAGYIKMLNSIKGRFEWDDAPWGEVFGIMPVPSGKKKFE